MELTVPLCANKETDCLSKYSSCQRKSYSVCFFCLLEKDLQSLRLENMKTMFVSLIFLSAGYVVYYYFYHCWVLWDEHPLYKPHVKSFNLYLVTCVQYPVIICSFALFAQIKSRQITYKYIKRTIWEEQYIML